MKLIYPILITPTEESSYLVYVPDLNINTQGDTIAQCIDMARDAIGIWGLCQLDAGREMPQPTTLQLSHAAEETVTLVDIDLELYRRANDMRTVRRNVSLPSWLNAEAEKAGLNVSAVLQNALKQELQTPRF